MKQFLQRSPNPALRALIKRYLFIEHLPEWRDTHLPDTSTVASFSLTGACRTDERQWISSAAFTGLHERARSHDHVDGHAVVLVVFTPVGASAFLRSPLDEVTGRTTDLADVLSAADSLGEWRDRLQAAKTPAGQLALTERFLLRNLRTPSPDPLVAAAVDWLGRTHGQRQMSDLVQHIGLSQSALERRFRRVTGCSPKKFASILRLRRAIHLHSIGRDLTTVAQEAGYFDQSHFIKHFHQAVGVSPGVHFA